MYELQAESTFCGFDFSYDDLRGEAWKATEAYEYGKNLRPDVIVDNRLEVSGEATVLLQSQAYSLSWRLCKPGRRMIPPNGIQDVKGNDIAWEAVRFTMNNHWGPRYRIIFIRTGLPC